MTKKRYRNRTRVSRSRASTRRRQPRSIDLVESFDAATEFEIVRGDLGDVEALAATAHEALEVLPTGKTPEKRREMNRLYTLVAFTARTATEALDRADEAQRRLDAHTTARRSSRPSSRRGRR